MVFNLTTAHIEVINKRQDTMGKRKVTRKSLVWKQHASYKVLVWVLNSVWLEKCTIMKKPQLSAIEVKNTSFSTVNSEMYPLHHEMSSNPQIAVSQRYICLVECWSVQNILPDSRGMKKLFIGSQCFKYLALEKWKISWMESRDTWMIQYVCCRPFTRQ